MCDVMETCADCGNDYLKRSMRRGRCSKCIRYEKKHGVKRPRDLKLRDRYCKVCGREREWGTGGNGKCKPCNEHFRRYGVDRDSEFVPYRKNGDPFPMCRHCKIRAAKYSPRKRMCSTCAAYMHRHNGKKRPRYYDAEHCRICSRPRVDVWFTHGRCPSCDDYHRRTGNERPEHLWKKRSPHGWCECGKPATHTVTMRVMHHDEHYPLCDGCYAEHQRHVAWYGSPDITTKGNIQAPRKTAKLYGDD